MDDRYEEIFRQYNFKIANIYRARGALLLETDKGVKLFRSIRNSKARIEFENKVLLFLKENGFENIDLYCLNRENQIVSESSQGDSYVVKDWFRGDECNLKEPSQVKIASANLAKLHKCLKEVTFATEREFPGVHMLPEVFLKHNRELKRVKTYIIDKRQKNEFEIRFLSAYDGFFDQAKEAESMLGGMDFTALKNQVKEKGAIVHGSYTYHNIILTQGKVYTTNFDKTDLGLQVYDLYYFMRKVLEKNNWNISLAQMMLSEYMENNQLEKKELELLYILMLYPEKFWKITNFYFNGKKSWVSGRTIQKLSLIKQQEEQKKLFLQNLYHYCIMDS